ncbi:MAG: HAMP domain-containing histidine kinase [Chloroflexi bacterium]|nr:HAMP domain-containing histidine kinase [Chloroflexota bacterium]
MATVDAPVLPETEIIVDHQQLIERLNALTHRIDRLRLLLKMVAEMTGASNVAFTSPDLWNTIFWVHETIVVDDKTLVGNTVVSNEVTPDLVEAVRVADVNPFDANPDFFVAREFGVKKVMALRADKSLWGFFLFREDDIHVPDTEWFAYVLSVLRMVATEHVTSSNQTKFVNEVAHDTKGVLAAVTLAADFMNEDLQKLKLTRKFTRQLGRLFESAQQASSLIDNGFGFGKYDPETDQIQMSLSEVDLFELRRGIVERFQLVAKFRNINLKLRGGRGKAVVMADRELLARAFTNLVQNAFKFTPPDGTVTMDIQKGDPVVVTVEDTGVGIAPEHHEAIFQRKFQVEQRSQYRAKGHGLGLFIVRKIVEQHGGTVHVESELGAGAKFVVKLPVNGPAGYYEDF